MYTAYKIRLHGIRKKSERTYIHNYVKKIMLNRQETHLLVIEKSRGGISEKKSVYKVKDIEKVWRKTTS